VLFQGFTDRDFDAYLDHKWQSNVFNRERLEVKQKLLALGKQLEPRLATNDGSLLTCEVSAEHPAVWNKGRVPNQHLFFSRSEAARRELDTIISRGRSIAALIDDPSPLRNHIFLSVMIDKGQLELAVKLHSDAAVDRDNLLRKSQEYFQREKLVRMIAGLPSGFQVGILGRPELTLDAADFDDDRCQKLLAELSGAASWLEVRIGLSRAEPRLGEASFAEYADEVLSKRLLPILNFAAWSRENDFLSMRETLKKREVEKKSRGLAKHDEVKVVRGMFAGKTGVVQEIDAKGAVKVQLGAVLVKLAGDDIAKL
jgi:hypothetical protein